MTVIAPKRWRRSESLQRWMIRTNRCGFAIRAPGETGTSVAGPPRFEMLSNQIEDIWVRSQAAEAVGRAGDQRALLPLAQHLNQDEPGIRAAFDPSELTSLQAVDALIQILSDSSLAGGN